jgi:hypothetical protein
MTNYHATPYDQSALGFYFDNYQDYQTKAEKHTNEYGDPVEEVEIQFIDGDNHQLFKALGINQANLETWFNDFELLDGDDLIRAIYMAEYLIIDISEILDRLDEVGLFHGRAKDYAEEYIEDSGILSELPENLRYYFDTEAFARDMLLSGDICEVEIMGCTYVIWEG